MTLLILVNVPFVFVAFLGLDLVKNALTHEKENKLVAITRVLDSFLGPGGFQEILEKNHSDSFSRQDKISELNNYLRDITDKVVQSSEGLGAGYYSKELDAIITYGPSSIYDYTVGLPIPAEHPGRQVMENDDPSIARGTMVRGNILNAMLPIIREDKIIGYIWANELEADVSAQLDEFVRDAEYVMLASFVLSAIVLILLSRRTVRDIDDVITGVTLIQENLSYRMPPLKGELGDVVTSINEMAANVSKATQETERAVAVLQSVMNNMDAAIIVCDPGTHRVVYANPYVLKLWNIETIGDDACYEALYNRTKPCKDCPLMHLFENGVPVYEPIYREKHDAKLNRDFLVADRLISWHDGRVVHLRVATDITDRKALMAAETANKAQRDFLARMSHEIRTPMNGVLGMTRLAIMENPSPKQHEYLNKIQSSASLLLGIINDILDFSRIEAGAMTIEQKPFQLHDVVHKVYELVLPKAQDANTELLLRIDNSVPQTIMGDSLRISQVLLNLLGNATKFTIDGSIDLVMHATTLSDQKLRLHCDIIDTGIGMNAQQQQDLFKPFSQADTSTSRKFGGTGLGLSICKALVELMDGQISVSSEEGKGSTFSFFVELEIYDSTQHDISLEEKPWDNVRYDGLRFLLVEDNLVNQEIALAVLGEFGIDADVADNGKDGVEAFMKNDYALILMDMRMPIMDGVEATLVIRGSDKHDAKSVPIVAMTANAMEEDREESLAIGMNGHIAKPIDMDEVRRVFYDCLVTNKAKNNS